MAENYKYSEKKKTMAVRVRNGKCRRKACHICLAFVAVALET
jgi:hypothetical protein